MRCGYCCIRNYSCGLKIYIFDEESSFRWVEDAHSVSLNWRGAMKQQLKKFNMNQNRYFVINLKLILRVTPKCVCVHTKCGRLNIYFGWRWIVHSFPISFKVAFGFLRVFFSFVSKDRPIKITFALNYIVDVCVCALSPSEQTESCVINLKCHCWFITC